MKCQENAAVIVAGARPSNNRISLVLFFIFLISKKILIDDSFAPALFQRSRNSHAEHEFRPIERGQVDGGIIALVVGEQNWIAVLAEDLRFVRFGIDMQKEGLGARRMGPACALPITRPEAIELASLQAI